LPDKEKNLDIWNTLLCNHIQKLHIFPRCMECQHRLAMRKVSVSPSVSPSVKHVDYDKTEERSV